MEKALSVIIITDKVKKDGWSAEEMISESDELIRSARVIVAERVVCNLKAVSPSLFLGKGKIEEIGVLADELGANVVIFSEDLSASQQKNIEDAISVKTIDRTQLILDIFARRARSGEGKIQVELAQLQYLLPRLLGKGILLSRLGGGIGTRGPGEQKLEADRRRINLRITKLKNELKRVAQQRQMRRKNRERFSMLTVALVGYTNAGKSTLLNALTGSDIYVDNMLFATLDPTIRKYSMPNNQKILLVDTVGFIYKLPHNLIESFNATLEEAVEADVLLHVMDMSDPKIAEQYEATYKVLGELEINDKPILTVLNKADKVTDQAVKNRLSKEYRDALQISALRKENLGELIDKITLHLGKLTAFVKLNIPAKEMRLLHLIYELGKVSKRINNGSTIYIEAQLPQRVAQMVQRHCERSEA